ncbi:MAG: SCO family protein [Gemmatimonadota bacterium]
MKRMMKPTNPSSDSPHDVRRRPLALAIAVLAAGLAFVVLVTSVPSKPEPSEPPALWDAPDFALIDQNGDTLRASDLDGAPWVASFVFTNCVDVCPTISARVARLRDSLAAEGRLGGDGVRLVSFTVDPERDSPDVLRGYAERYGGSPPDRWAFLTGEPASAVRELIQEGFRLSAVRPHSPADDGGYQVVHSPRLLLVDGDGIVRATYPATDAGVVARVLEDLRTIDGSG